MTEDEMEALLEEFNGVLDADDRTVFCDRAPGSLANRLREMELEAQLSQEDGEGTARDYEERAERLEAPCRS